MDLGPTRYSLVLYDGQFHLHEGEWKQNGYGTLVGTYNSIEEAQRARRSKQRGEETILDTLQSLQVKLDGYVERFNEANPPIKTLAAKDFQQLAVYLRNSPSGNMAPHHFYTHVTNQLFVAKQENANDNEAVKVLRMDFVGELTAFFFNNRNKNLHQFIVHLEHRYVNMMKRKENPQQKRATTTKRKPRKSDPVVSQLLEDQQAAEALEKEMTEMPTENEQNLQTALKKNLKRTMSSLNEPPQSSEQSTTLAEPPIRKAKKSVPFGPPIAFKRRFVDKQVEKIVAPFIEVPSYSQLMERSTEVLSNSTRSSDSNLSVDKSVSIDEKIDGYEKENVPEGSGGTDKDSTISGEEMLGQEDHNQNVLSPTVTVSTSLSPMGHSPTNKETVEETVETNNDTISTSTSTTQTSTSSCSSSSLTQLPSLTTNAQKESPVLPRRAQTTIRKTTVPDFPIPPPMPTPKPSSHSISCQTVPIPNLIKKEIVDLTEDEDFPVKQEPKDGNVSFGGFDTITPKRTTVSVMWPPVSKEVTVKTEPNSSEEPSERSKTDTFETQTPIIVHLDDSDDPDIISL